MPTPDINAYHKALIEAAEQVDIIQPPELRAPIYNWLKETERQSRNRTTANPPTHNELTAWQAALAINKAAGNQE